MNIKFLTAINVADSDSELLDRIDNLADWLQEGS
jgi:hypothetical protein